MRPRLVTRVNFVLQSLFALDLVLTGWVFLFPQSWARMFHDTILIDPHGFLPRMGANWLAFAVLQGIACLRWEKAPYWLLLVAGARFGDVLTDWTYLAAASSRTPFAWLMLGGALPANLGAGWFLLKSYKEIAKKRA